MDKQLIDYINSPSFRDALRIPEGRELMLYPLARGEYNINYSFIHPETGEKLVFRVNTASQLHLENQIEYEYRALRLLERTKRTPRAYFVDSSKGKLPYGVLVMEFLEGRALDYTKDLNKASAIFADIHNSTFGEGAAEILIKPANPLQAMLEECIAMGQVFLQSPHEDIETKRTIERLLHKAASILSRRVDESIAYTVINTEVNSSNFLINEDGDHCYLIDWEKPILGESVQDLAHFAAPTTTFWKTDVLLEKDQIEDFIRSYIKYSEGKQRYDHINEGLGFYLPLNCLRGITWCAMAWVQYRDSSKLIQNEDTYKKLGDYLREDFLNKIEKDYFNKR